MSLNQGSGSKIADKENNLIWLFVLVVVLLVVLPMLMGGAMGRLHARDDRYNGIWIVVYASDS